MAENFLPEYRPSVTHDKRKTLMCLARGKHVTANPEEFVRQRVLNWLITERNWTPDRLWLEKSYTWVSDKKRKRLRPDILLVNKGDEVELVVECKAEHVPLTDAVSRQTNEYAIKSRSNFIWMTNGKDHKFMAKKGREWKIVNSLKILDVSYQGESIFPKFPNLLNEHEIDNYLAKRKAIHDPDFTNHPDEMKKLVMGIHKILFYNDQLTLPYSYSGVHILEDCGPMYLEVSNKGGKRYFGWYRGLVAGTSGRVETLILTVNYRESIPDGAQICVGTITDKGLNHRLQLNLNEKNCTFNESKKCWEISHGGRMSWIENKDVFEAVRESGAEHLIYRCHNTNKDRLNLGDLHNAENSNWGNSKDLIANLLHYGLIRYNLRLSNSGKQKIKCGY